jgi:rRNA maturation endonuclease Nob1
LIDNTHRLDTEAHFRTDPSYLPELRGYLDSLLQARERIRSALDLDDWARTEAMPSNEEITRLRQLIRRAERDLSQLSEADRRQIAQAVDTVRATRRAVHLGMPAIRPLPEEGLA